MESLNLNSFYHPRSIAIVGASKESASIGGRLMQNLLHHGYKGDIYPINPKYEEIAGLSCAHSVLDVEREIDLVMIAVSKEKTMQVLKDCSVKKVKFVVLLNAGFAETGKEGQKIQDEMVKLSKQAGTRIVGPNCIGCLNIKDAVPLTFYQIDDALLPGPVGLVSQSGALGYTVFTEAQEEKIGFSYLANPGNQVDIHILDFLSFMLEDDSTKLVAGYLEAIPDGRQLITLAQRAITLNKPLILLKSGTSELGRKAAISHTASLTGSEKSFQAVAKQNGMISVTDTDDLIDMMKIFTPQKRPNGKNVTVITTSGASGILMADHCEHYGLTMNSLKDSTHEKLATIIPDYGSTLNPVDTTAQVTNDPKMWRKTMEAVVEDENTDIVVLTTTISNPKMLAELCAEIVKIDSETDKPIVVMLNGSKKSINDGKIVLRSPGIPVYDSTQRATKAISSLVWFTDFCRENDFDSLNAPSSSLTVRENTERNWTEVEVKDLLPKMGITVPERILVHNKEELERKADNIHFPVVSKIISPDILHKTDLGVVKLNIQNKQELFQSYDALIHSVSEHASFAVVNGVLVEEMIQEKGVELFVGIKDDVQFGPLIVCGLGGVFIEVLGDAAIRHVPISLQQAFEMLASLKGYPLLTGARGAEKMDTEALAHALVKLSHFADQNRGSIKEMDINPFVVLDHGVIALDGMVVWHQTAEKDHTKVLKG